MRWHCSGFVLEGISLGKMGQRGKLPFQKKFKWVLLKVKGASNPTPGHIPGENHNSKRYMHPNVHCSVVYNSQDMEET